MQLDVDVLLQALTTVTDSSTQVCTSSSGSSSCINSSGSCSSSSGSRVKQLTDVDCSVVLSPPATGRHLSSASSDGAGGGGTGGGVGVQEGVVAAQWTSTWSILHLALLRAILSFPSVPACAQLELLTLSDMQRNIDGVVRLINAPLLPGVGGGLLRERAGATCVDRLVQLLQVSLATGAFRCSLGRTIPRSLFLSLSQHNYMIYLLGNSTKKFLHDVKHILQPNN